MIFLEDLSNEKLVEEFEKASYDNAEVGVEGNWWHAKYEELKLELLDRLNANS